MTKSHSDALEACVARLEANALAASKLYLGGADFAQAADIYVAAHRAGREDIKARVRSILDRGDVAPYDYGS